MKSEKKIPKTFIGFLIASFFIWVLITFSKEYKTVISYDVNFKNIPQKNIILETNTKQIKILAKATGFKLFWTQILQKSINLDVSKINQKKATLFYFFPKNQLSEIQKQLTSGVFVESILKDTMFVNVGFLASKKVALKPNLNINYHVGYDLLGDVKVIPDSIVISGDENEIKDIKFLNLESVKLKNQKSDFSKKVFISRTKMNKNLKFSASKAKIYAKVDKFTQGSLKVHFKVLNLPSNIKLTKLSDSVTITYVVALSNFSRVSKESFVVECDFKMSQKNGLSYLIPKVIFKSEFVRNVKIIPNKIDFLIQK